MSCPPYFDLERIEIEHLLELQGQMLDDLRLVHLLSLKKRGVAFQSHSVFPR
jgi:hypothetical protein